jgi:hypothetical protein
LGYSAAAAWAALGASAPLAAAALAALAPSADWAALASAASQYLPLVIAAQVEFESKV